MLVNGFSAFLGILITLATLITILMSFSYVRRQGIAFADYLTLLLLSGTGMLITVYANELVTLFLGIELMSIPIYLLVAIRRDDPKSHEAGLKYLVLGAFASAFLLFGFMLLYGLGSANAATTQQVSDYVAQEELPIDPETEDTITVSEAIPDLGTGSTVLTDLSGLAATETGAGNHLPLIMLALGLIVIGFGFKVGAIPFHQWVPDVYDGSPTAITGFMATAVKVAGFGAFLRVLTTCFPGLKSAATGVSLGGYAVLVLIIIAMVTILGGNFLAMTQESIKRMLAYSSIAHTGYLLMGLIAISANPGGQGGPAILYYLSVYLFMTLGAFAIVIVAAGRTGKEYDQVDQLQGLAQKRPFWAFAMALAMLSLAGIPPLPGFIGKLWIFYATIEAGGWPMVALAIVAVLGTFIGAYYYLRVVWVMYMKDPAEGETFEKDESDWSLNFAVGVTVAGTFLLMVFWFTFLRFAEEATHTLTAVGATLP